MVAANALLFHDVFLLHIDRYGVVLGLGIEEQDSSVKRSHEKSCLSI